MKLAVPSNEAVRRFRRLEDWHPWFAWRPVRVGDQDVRWMEWVERKSEFVGAYDGVYRFNKYRVAASIGQNVTGPNATDDTA